MKKRGNRILVSILLLLTFLTGQVIVFAHMHKLGEEYSVDAKKDKSKTADTKCQICAQSSHVQLFLQIQQLYFWDNSSSYIHVAYSAVYQSIKLLLSGNRGPPVKFFSCKNLL